MTERIREEYSISRGENTPLVTVNLYTNDIRKWRYLITGPEDSPYSGGKFEISVEFKPTYPADPPSFFFITPIYHPNIASNGAVCISVIDSQYQSRFRVAYIMNCIISLLINPVPNDFMPDRQAIAEQCIRNRAEFNQMAREHTLKHANSS